NQPGNYLRAGRGTNPIVRGPENSAKGGGIEHPAERLADDVNRLRDGDGHPFATTEFSRTASVKAAAELNPPLLDMATPEGGYPSPVTSQQRDGYQFIGVPPIASRN
ncbi:MAG: hypothetical protein LQ341_007050, partial [Variospora aurantia]